MEQIEARTRALTHKHSVYDDMQHQLQPCHRNDDTNPLVQPESMNMTFHLILECFFLTRGRSFLCTSNNTAIRTGQSQNSLT